MPSSPSSSLMIIWKVFGRLERHFIRRLEGRWGIMLENKQREAVNEMTSQKGKRILSIDTRPFEIEELIEVTKSIASIVDGKEEQPWSRI